MAASKTATAATGALGVGALAGFTLDPDKGLELLKWLNTALGPVGFIATVCLGAGLAVAVYGDWLMWQRLKEKDDECRAETGRQREAWKSVVDSEEADNREIARAVTDLLVQVTRLTERAGIGRTRSS